MLSRTVNKAAGNFARAVAPVAPRRPYHSYLTDNENTEGESLHATPEEINTIAHARYTKSVDHSKNLAFHDYASVFRKDYNDGFDESLDISTHGVVQEKTGDAYDINFRRSQVTHPDGHVYKRFGGRNRDSFDSSATPEQQANYVRRRVVENIQNLPHTTKLIGDAVIQQGRLASLEERLKLIFKDDARPFLDSTTRTSPIYRDVKPQQRTPRVLLPNDTATGLSPTSGVLHAYRMHHIRMHMIAKKKLKHVLAEKIESLPEDVVDTKVTPIEAIGEESNEKIQEFVEYFYHMARLNANNRVAVTLTHGLKDIIPLIVKMDTKEVVQIRKRKK